MAREALSVQRRGDWRVVFAAGLLVPCVLAVPGRATGQDVFVSRGVPQLLDRDKQYVVVGLRSDTMADFTESIKGYFPGRSDVAIVKLDSTMEDTDLALERLPMLDAVEFAAPLYRGAAGGAFTVLPEAVVRFRPGVGEGARVEFYAEYGLDPAYEYPSGSGRVVCRVVGGGRERETLDAVNEAYFDDRVEHVSPGFLQEPRWSGDCYDTAYVPPNCAYMGPGGLDCPPPDPTGCRPQPVCPSCSCTRFPMTLLNLSQRYPWLTGVDAFANEFHQFEHMGIWDAWAITRGSEAVKIAIVDTRVDRDHRDVGPQVAVDLEPGNARKQWNPDSLRYAVTLPPQASAPAFIYFYFVDPPEAAVSGSSLAFHIDNLKIQESGAGGAEKQTYTFEAGDTAWQAHFSTPPGSNHAFGRKALGESGCPSESFLGTYVLRVEATGAGDRVTSHIRVAVPGLEANMAYYVSADWIPHCASKPPFEGFLRFGIDGDSSCPPRFGGEMGRSLEGMHGTTVAAIACGADDADDFGVTGVAPDSRLVAVSASGTLTGSGDASAVLAAAAVQASILSSSAQLQILSDDYLDAFRTFASYGRGGKGAPLSFSAGNDHRFVFGIWISATELATSVGALALVTPVAGEPYWARGCNSSYGADLWVLDHRVFQVPATWGYETYGFTTADPQGADPSVPGDFVHYDEVRTAARRVETSTSWCAPVVSGIYALILSRDLDLTREEATQILYHTAKRPDAQGRINGFYLDCALPGGPCSDQGKGVDPSPGCTAFPVDEQDPSYVDKGRDIPFDPVTSRSRVFGYGLVDALAAVQAANPASPKRWPEPARAISIAPGKTAGGSRRVRVSWIPPEANRVARGYDGYILVRSIGAPLSALPLDGTAPPAPGVALGNGVVVARGDASAGTLATYCEDPSALAGLRFYALFYYRKMGGPQEYYYSFGTEARIVYSSTRWKTVTTYQALVNELASGLDSGDPSRPVVLFVDSSSPIALLDCLQVGENVRGSMENGRVYIVGDKNLGGAKTKLVVPAAKTGIAVCGSRYLSVSGFTIEGGDVGLGVWKKDGPTRGCASCPSEVGADEIEVWNCRFDENQIGLWLENEGDVVLQNSVVRATGSPVDPEEAAGIYFPLRADPEVVNDHRTLYSILNNTIDVAGRPCLRVHMKSLAQTFTQNGYRPRLQVFNNILRASGSLGVCVELGDAGHIYVSNHNDFVVVPPASCGRVQTPAPGTSHATLADWRSASRSDKHSLSADPDFVNLAAGDYHLASRLSPVVNAGTTGVYEPRFVCFDFDGPSKARVRSGSAAGGAYGDRYIGIDIGADEFHSAVQDQDANVGYPFRRGDANNDGTVDVSDAIYVLNFMFLGGPAPVCFDAADANDDESVDVSDPSAILSFLNVGTSWYLPPPYPDCGFDVYRVGSTTAPNESPYYCGPATVCP